ncbi:MAG: hypothetical protein HY962_07160 [Ignavibacteriae bacterium]|nr:hypothetical protein [Ignavibacteriota bacterium]
MELSIVHDTATGWQLARQRRHEETVSTPATEITIEHAIDYRYPKVDCYDAAGYLVPPSRILELECGEHSPVTANRYFVRIIFADAFSGVIVLHD